MLKFAMNSIKGETSGRRKIVIQPQQYILYAFARIYYILYAFARKIQTRLDKKYTAVARITIWVNVPKYSFTKKCKNVWVAEIPLYGKPGAFENLSARLIFVH